VKVIIGIGREVDAEILTEYAGSRSPWPGTLSQPGTVSPSW
jgi:hypothetical protein